MGVSGVRIDASGLSDKDVDKFKIWGSDYPKEHPICGYWAIKSERMVVGLDCHDDQNPGSSSRDMGDKGSVYIKEKDANKHRGFSKELFTRTDRQWKIGKERMKAMGVEAEVHNVSDII